MFQRLLDDIAGHSVLSECYYIPLDKRGHDLSAVCWGAVLKDMLDNVVPKRMAAERVGVGNHCQHEQIGHLLGAVLKESLNYPAAKPMPGNGGPPLGIRRKLVHHKMKSVGWHDLDALLQNMVPMGRLEQLSDMAAELVNERNPILATRNFECFLHNAAAAQR